MFVFVAPTLFGIVVLLNAAGVLLGTVDATVPAVMANVGPAALDPLIRFFRSSNESEFESASFLPVNSLSND